MTAALSQTIEAPQAGQTIVVHAGSLRTIAFAFNLADAVVERSGAEYIIRLPNGGIIILRGIAEGGEDDPVLLLLPDGSGVPLLEAFGRMESSPDGYPALKTGEGGQEGQGAEEDSEGENGSKNEDKSADADGKADAQGEAFKPDGSPDASPDGSPDSSPDSSRDAESPGPNQPMRNQDGNDSGGASSAASGVGEFRSDAGNLVYGVWALPDQGTKVWNWDNGDASRQEGQDQGGSGGPVYVPGTSIILSGATVNESEGFAFFTVSLTARSGAGTLTLALTGGSAVAGSDYSATVLECLVDGVWESVTIAADGSFVLPVTGSDSLTLRLPIDMDNHLESGAATIGLAVVSLTGPDGTPLTDYTNDTRLSCQARITDDSRDSCGTAGVAHEKDGPLVSIVRTSAEVLYEDPSGVHTFQIALKDCINSGADYHNPDNSGALLQDITIVLHLDGRATLGDDYDFKVSDEMQALIDAGKMTVSGLDSNGTISPDAQGNITVILHGSHDGDGGLSAKTPLEEGDFAGLFFEAVISDDYPHREAPENIRLTILSVRGNEAQIGTDTAEGKIADDAQSVNGPHLSWAAASSSVNESASPDHANAPANNTNWHTIELDMAASDPIRVLIELSGKDGAVRFNGGNAAEADFQWGGSVQYSTDNGNSYVTLDSYTYDPATGQCALTIPAGATNVRFDVTIIDDMREADESGHSYDVSLSLELDGDGMADCDAVLVGNLVDGSLTQNVDITPDPARPTDGTVLNPSSYDGPFVVLQADTDTTGLTDDGNGGFYAPESGDSVLPFTLSLLDPSGSGLFTGSEEAVTVTLTISGSDGFQLQDLFAPTGGGSFSGSIPYTVYNDDRSVASTGTATCSGGNAQAGSADFQLTLPPGANTVVFHLPVNDDALGGTSSADSSIERAEETVTVTIKNVSGNEARVNTTEGHHSDSQVIRDDTAGDGFEGIQVGLAWNSGVSGGLIQEGVTGVIALKLFEAEAEGGDALSSANTPYAKYTGSNTTLPEDLTVSLRFTDTDDGISSGGDMALMFSSDFLALVDAGKITVSIGDAEYTTKQSLQDVKLDGEFTVALKGGSFTFSDASSLTLNAHVFGDNVNEYDAVKNYADEHDASLESFGLKITGVSGNESSIKTGAHEAQAVITDMADGKLTLSGGDLHAATNSTGGYWSFAIAVTYSDGEKTNDPASASSAGSVAGSAVKLPGEDIVLHLRVTDGAMMQHGEEYEVSAYQLFLSLNGSSAENVSESAYADYVSGVLTPDADWIIVTLAENWDADSSALFKLEVPQEYWSSHADGTIAFNIAQGYCLGGKTGDGDGGFTVKLEAVPGVDFKGEITEVTEGVTGAIRAKEDDGVSIQMSLDYTPTIYENSDGTHSNVAAYTMKFTQMRDSAAITGDLALACDIVFDFTLKPGTAEFNENTGDNDLYDTMGDFAISDASGNLYAYNAGDLNSLKGAIQAIFDNDPNYEIGDVTVTVTQDGSGAYKLSFTIKEGVDLTHGITLYFVAMDDNITDSNSFSAQISNVGSDGNAVAISIVGNQAGTTTISDESGGMVSGFAIAIGDGTGYEKLVGAKLVDGNGNSLDGKIHMPLYAYALSNGHMPGFILPDGTNSSPADGSILSLAVLIRIYEAKTGDYTVTVEDAAAHDAFRDFIVDHFKPTQPITVSMELTGSSDAAVNADFQDKTTQTVDAGSGWKLVIDSDGFVYFENELTIDSINDYTEMSGGEITFGVKVKGSDNNESRPVDAGDSGKLSSGHGASATGHIKDFHDGPYIVSSGPANDTLYEPVDGSHNGTVAPKANAYAIQLNRATEEDMVVWLKIGGNTAQEGTNPAAGDDYFLGSGIYKYLGNGKCSTWDEVNKEFITDVDVDSLDLPDGVDLSGMEDAYFLVIKAGNASGSFDINVLDDNKTESDEKLVIEVIKVEGGEATYLSTVGEGADAKEYTVPWSDSVPYLYAYMNGGVRVEVLVDPANKTYYVLDDSNGGAGVKHGWTDGGEPGWLPAPSEANEVTIADDGFGPRVSVTGLSWADDDSVAPTITLHLEEACQENVEVTITLTIPGVGTDPAVTKTLTFKLDKGFSGSVTISADDVLAKWNASEPTSSQMPDRDDISGMVQVQLVGSGGGETVHSGDGRYLIIHHGGTNVIWLSELQISESGALPSGLTENSLPDDIGGYGTITVTMSVPDSTSGFSVSEDVTFTINVPASSSLGNGTATQYTVTIPKDVVAEMQSEGGNVTITLKPDADGKPILTASANGQSWTIDDDGLDLTLGGGDKLPALKGDTVIGEEGGVTCSITGNTGAYLHENGSTVEYVPFKDNTFATIKLFIETADGKFVLLENGAELLENLGAVTVKAVLVLTDAAGNMIDANGDPISSSGPNGATLIGDIVQVTTDEALEFSIQSNGKAGITDADGVSVDGAADPGADYTASSSLRIAKGDSSGDFVLNITQDNKSEGKEGFELSLVPTQDTKNSAKEELKRLTGNTATEAEEYEFGRTEGIITDDNSGPIISWKISTHETPEDGSITLAWESYLAGSRQVVVEDVEMVFELTPADGFTMDEIASITVNGIPYAGSDLASILTDAGSGKWLLTLAAGVNKDEGLGTLTIQLKDDVISEGAEKLSIHLKSVNGGETTRASENQPEPVIITETVDGPKVDLVAVSAGEDDLTVVYELKLQGGSPTGEDGTVILTINEESRAFLDLTGGNEIVITLPDSSKVTVTVGVDVDTDYCYDPSTGKLIVTIPQGSAGGQSFTITIPVKDDALSEERNFGMSIITIDNGEMAAAAAVAYSVEFVKESAEVSGVGGYNEYVIKAASNPGCHASLRFEVTGIAAESVIDTLYLGDTALAKDVDWVWDNGKVIVTSEVADMLTQYGFKITYKLAAAIGPDGETLLSQTKDNIRVENPGMTDREVVITIANESDESGGGDKEGPVASLALPVNVVEGEMLTGTIVITMPGLAGEGNALLEDITITLTVPDSELFDLSGAAKALGCTCDVVDGTTVTVTVPKGAQYTPGTPPTIEIDFEALIPDNSLNGGISGDDNPSYSFAIDGITGEDDKYEAYSIDQDAADGIDVTVLDEADADQDALTLSVSFDTAAATEGETLTGVFCIEGGDLDGDTGTVSGTIRFEFTASANPDGTYNAISLNLTPAQEGKVTLLDNGDGTYIVTVLEGAPLPADIAFTVTVDDNSLQSNPDYTIALKDDSFTANAYEKAEIDSTGRAAGATVINDDVPSPSGATWSVTAQDAVEGGDLEFTISSSGDAWNDVVAGGTVRVYFTFDSAVNPADVTGAVWDADESCFYVEMTKGQELSKTVTVKTEDNAIGEGSRPLTLTVIGDDTFETNAGANETATLTDETQGDGFLLSLSGAQAEDGSNSMTFSIALAAQGDYFGEDDPIVSSISFDLNLTGFSEAQMQDIADALDAQLNVSASYEGGVVSVTLSADYVYDPDAPLSFTVDAAEGGSQVYAVAIDPDSVISGLEVAGVEPGAGSDTVTLDLTLGNSMATSDQQLYGGDGNDTIRGGLGNDTIYGGAGNDTIHGGDGNDVIYAGNGGAVIEGGGGDDVIFAGGGLDILNGGPGEDLFVWDKDNFGGDIDVIEQFTYLQDMIGISGIFTAQEDLDDLLEAGGEVDENTFSFMDADTGNGIAAAFTDRSTLELTLTSQGGQTQNITINADDAFYTASQSLNETLAQDILANILRIYSE